MSNTITTIVHKVQRVVLHPKPPPPQVTTNIRREMLETETEQAPQPLPTYGPNGLRVVYQPGGTVDRTA